MNRILNYFNDLSEKIAIEGRMSNTSSNKSDIGVNREIIVKLFFNNHLPKRLNASLGGQIIGYDNTESSQIDIIVSSDISIRFEEREKTFITAESVACAISVKSFLDKEAIFDSLRNLASIPQLSPMILDFKLLINQPFRVFVEKYPSLNIFAYDGVSAETCLKHITNFYAENHNIPKNRYPHEVIVNKKYVISYIREHTKTNSGEIIETDTFYAKILEENMYGYPFFRLLTYITDYVDWLPFIRINIINYFRKTYGFPVE